MPEHTPAPTPTRAVYGFVMFLSFKIFFVLYLVWAIVPENYFELIGIDFLPQRYWAIAVPIYLLTVLTVFAFGIYPGLGQCMTPNVDDLRTIKDEIGDRKEFNRLETKGNENVGLDCVCINKEKCFKRQYESIKLTIVNKPIPSVQDLDMWEVSENIFLK